MRLWCLALAERCDIRDRTSDEVRLRLDRLEAERDNLRVAMAWLLDSGEIETALCLGTKLHFLWTNRGPASEGRAWLKRAVATPGNHPASPAIRGLAAQTASILAWMEGAFDEAATLAGEALVLAREGSVEADCVWALNLLGMAATSLGHYDEAAAHLDAALALYHKLGAGRGVSVILTNRAVVAGCRRTLAATWTRRSPSVAKAAPKPSNSPSSSTNWGVWHVSKATSLRWESDSAKVSTCVGRRSIFGRCRRPWKVWPAWLFRRHNRSRRFAWSPPQRRCASVPAVRSWWPIAATTIRSCSGHANSCRRPSLRPRGTKVARRPWRMW